MRLVYSLPLAALLLLNIALVAIGTYVGGTVLYSERNALRAVRQLNDLLRAQEFLSRERGPTNGALGSPLFGQEAFTEKLIQARDASNVALTRAIVSLGDDGQDGTVSQIVALQNLQNDVAKARSLVDRMLALPVQERRFGEIDRTVHAMTDLIPPLSLVVARAGANVMRADPSLAPIIAIARAAADLREYAGKIGSVFTASLATERPFTAAQINEIRILQGQVRELRHEVTEGFAIATELQAQSRLETALAAMETHYFTEATALLEQVISVGLKDGGFPLTAEWFAELYVPAMGSILDVRDAAMENAKTAVEIDIKRRLLQFLATVAAGVLSLAIAITATLALRQRIINPMLDLANQVFLLASGARTTPIHTRATNPLIRRLATAIEELRQAANKLNEITSREAALEARRAELLRKLEIPLTSIEKESAALCLRVGQAKAALRQSAEALAQLGPRASEHRTRLNEAADCAAEQSVQLDSHAVRLCGLATLMRDLTAKADLQGDRLASSRMRSQAAGLLSSITAVSQAIGRMNLAGMAAMSALVTDPTLADAAAICRPMANRTVDTAEDLGQGMGALNGAIRQIMGLLDQLDRSTPAAKPDQSGAVVDKQPRLKNQAAMT
jgi:hypothetical protein